MQRHPSDVERNDNVFCSKNCSAKYYNDLEGSEFPSFQLDGGNGYPQIHADGKTVSVHQLVSISKGADPYKAFGRNEWTIHHRNGCKVDNRPSNLEMMGITEHGREHGKKRGGYSHKDLLYVVDLFTNLSAYVD